MPDDTKARVPGQSGERYRPTLADRLGADVGLACRSVAFALVVFAAFLALFSVLARLEDFSTLLIVPFALLATGVVMYAGYRIGLAAGGGFLAFVMPTGDSTPYDHQFSYQEAIAVGGDPAAALESFESLIASTPIEARYGVELRVRAAEMAIRAGATGRAVELFREVQRSPRLETGRDLYVSNRLIDLFVGRLGEPGRALVELRRLVVRYPNSNIATRSRDAIDRIKGWRGP